MLKPEQLIVGGKYKLVEPIGSGSFGDVWLALEVKSNTQVAIKVGRAGDRESQERSDREVVCRRFDHPHLLRADTVEEEGEALYLVFPYAAGGSLRKHLEEQERLPADEAVGIAVAIADGLGYLHHRDFVHRDVHPGNILFTGDGVVKLSDFGLVQSHLFSYDLWYGRRIGGRQPGNALYQPLEAWAEEGRPLKPLDPNADMYMLGAVVWEMLTGRVHYHNRGKPVRALQPDVPGWLDELVQRCLDEDPAARPENGSQLARLLQEGQAAEEQRIRRANLYQQGKDALESGEWPAAIKGLEALLRELPEYQDAAELLRQAREGQQREEGEQAIRGLVKEAQEALDRSDWETLEKTVSRLQPLSPQEASPFEEALAAEQTCQQERQHRLTDWYTQASELAETDPRRALELVVQVRAEQPEYPDLDALEARANEAIANLYRDGRDALEAGRWAEAIKGLDRLLDQSPDYRGAVQLLEQAREGQRGNRPSAPWWSGPGKHRAGLTGASWRRSFPILDRYPPRKSAPLKRHWQMKSSASDR